MDDFKRIIKITTATDTYQAVVKTDKETINREELFAISTSLSGSQQKQITGETLNYSYFFPYCWANLLDFFNYGYNAGTFTFERELDDGTFESFSAFCSQPIYQEKNISTLNKYYKDLEVAVYKQ